MAEEAQEQNKSEQATPFKLAKAREKGAVARGVDLGFLVGLLVFTGFLWNEGPLIGLRLAVTARQAIVTAPDALASPQAILTLTGGVLGSALARLAWLPAVIFCLVLAAEVIQTGPVFTTHTLRLDFTRLNPAQGLKRVFSPRLLIETVKNILKMAVYGLLTVLVLRYAWSTILPAVTDASSLAALMARVALRLLGFFVLAAAAFAVLDQLIVRGDFQKRMRMSRRDIRRELRDREGEPRLKQQRRRLHRQFATLAKGMRNIRDADLLITNPTHYAVALRYDPTLPAPLIVAQAQNQAAMRLRRLAFIYGVNTVQSPVLARQLYHRGQFERPIPEACYRAVAELYIAMREQSQKSR